MTVEDLGGQPIGGKPSSAPLSTTEPVEPDEPGAPTEETPGGDRPRRRTENRRAVRLRRIAIVVFVVAIGGLGVWVGVGWNQRYGATPQPLVVNLGATPGTAISGTSGTVPGLLDPADPNAIEVNQVISMPDVIGLDETAAREALADAGIDNADVDVTELPFVGPAGRIIKQSPTRQSSNPGRVQLWKAKQATMPDVIKQQATDATSALEAIGLRVVKVDRYTPGEVKGAVIDTDVKAGEDLGQDLGKQVTIFVATDPSQIFLDQVSPTDYDCSPVSTSSSSSTPLRVGGDVVTHGVSCSVYASSSSSSSPPSQNAEVNEYDIAKKVDYFEVSVGLSDSSPSSARVHFEIWSGNEKLAVADASALDPPQKLTVLLSGRLNLKLVAYATSTSSSSSSSNSIVAVWVDPKLSGSPGQIDEIGTKKP